MTSLLLSRTSSWVVLLVFSLALGACGDATGAAAGSGGGSVGGSGAAGGGGSQNGGGGQAPTSCWEDDVTNWDPLQVFDGDRLAGEGFHDPMLSPDGLALYYVAAEAAAAPTRVHRATRASRAEEFAGGEQLATWTGFYSVSHPWVVGTQMFLTFDEGGAAFRLAASIFDGSQWSYPTALEPLINDTTNFTAAGNATASADARSLMFQRYNPGFDIRLYEAVRSEGVPGQPFSSVAPVVIPGITAGDDGVICATLSPDGQHLFFSTTFPNDISGGIPDGSVTVWYTKRATSQGPWEIPIHVAAFDDPTALSCVYTVTGDGCEVWVEHFVLNVPDSPKFVIARR